MILLLLASVVVPFIERQAFNARADVETERFAKVLRAVDARNFNDGFLFSYWDENGGIPPTNATLSWDEGNDFQELLGLYLISATNASCGDAALGWDPANEGGVPDVGAETSVENAALIPCGTFAQKIPYNFELSAALSPDPVYDTVARFRMYINFEDALMYLNGDEEVTMVKMQKISNALENNLIDVQYGTPNVFYGNAGALLDDIDDDVSYNNATECEDAIAGGDECVVIAELDYAGNTNGKFKTTDNSNSHVDDVTFTQGFGAGRQQCAYWSEVAGAWVADIVDCAIKAGIDDDDVTLVFDGAQSSNFLLTRKIVDGGVPEGFVEVNHLCTQFEPEELGANNASRDDDKMQLVALADESPCGLTDNGAVVQLLTDEIYSGIAYVEEVVSDDIFAERVSIYSDIAGDLVMKVFNSNHTALVFTLDNNGNMYAAGTATIDGTATMNSNAIVNGTLTANDDINFALNDAASTFNIGRLNGNAGMSITRDVNSFVMHSNSTRTEFVAGDGLDEGVILEDQGDGNIEMRLKADHGVIAENGTDIHASFSTLLNQEFSAAGVTTEELKAVSKMVTSDMAKYLDDTSSPIQIVGIERVEGEFLQLTKPNCLSFMDDANYSSAAANPYREIIDDIGGALGSGESYARIVLVPMYFKTYNSAFGDNQVFSQHAAHSSATTWDIYLYLSGEGAFGTGAREDGAGGSLAMVLCDYSSINFSRQTF